MKRQQASQRSEKLSNVSSVDKRVLQFFQPLSTVANILDRLGKVHRSFYSFLYSMPNLFSCLYYQLSYDRKRGKGSQNWGRFSKQPTFCRRFIVLWSNNLSEPLMSVEKWLEACEKADPSTNVGILKNEWQIFGGFDFYNYSIWIAIIFFKYYRSFCKDFAQQDCF